LDEAVEDEMGKMSVLGADTSRVLEIFSAQVRLRESECIQAGVCFWSVNRSEVQVAAYESPAEPGSATIKFLIDQGILGD
jgi:hypothetical protein